MSTETLFGSSVGGTRPKLAVRDVIFLVRGFIDLSERLEEDFLDFEDFGLLTMVIVHICNKAKVLFDIRTSKIFQKGTTKRNPVT